MRTLFGKVFSWGGGDGALTVAKFCSPNISMYLRCVHDEGALLHVGSDPQEGEEPDPALDRINSLHKRYLENHTVRCT